MRFTFRPDGPEHEHGGQASWQAHRSGWVCVRNSASQSSSRPGATEEGVWGQITRLEQPRLPRKGRAAGVTGTREAGPRPHPQPISLSAGSRLLTPRWGQPGPLLGKLGDDTGQGTRDKSEAWWGQPGPVNQGPGAHRPSGEHGKGRLVVHSPGRKAVRLSRGRMTSGHSRGT